MWGREREGRRGERGEGEGKGEEEDGWVECVAHLSACVVKCRMRSV